MKMETKEHFSGSYGLEDVRFLLVPRDIAMIDVASKEMAIQSGTRHYSEMLSPEKVPDQRYLDLYDQALARNASRLNADIDVLADAIQSQYGKTVTIASLARAGTPIGVLLARRLRSRGVDVAHYSISIIRDRGIDVEAMATIRSERGSEDTVFVDGWTGKGAIMQELVRSLSTHAPDFAPHLAVVADPAGCATMAATTEDYVIPSGLLNGIVSGLISRSVLSDEHVGPGDYHACLFQKEMTPNDRSLQFIDAIEASRPARDGEVWTPEEAVKAAARSRAAMDYVKDQTGVMDVNRIKPGIAEATRAILRRVPDGIFIRDMDDPEIEHILHLARSAGITVQSLPDASTYRAITLIKKVSE